MPKTVEIIGPSGSGKTAVYRNLRSQWKDDYNWVAFDDLNRSKKRLRKRYFKKALQIILEILTGNNPKKKNTQVASKWEIINYDNLIFLGDKYTDLSTLLMDLVEEHSAVWYDGSDKRFITIYMLMWSIAHFEKVVTIKNDDRFCVLKECEGFVNRIMHLNSPSFNEEALLKYLKGVPLPNVLIFLEISTDEIVQRIKTRNRLSTLHKGLNDEAIYTYTQQTIHLFNIAIKFAEKRGTRIYRVNASDTLTDLSSEIIRILSSETI